MKEPPRVLDLFSCAGAIARGFERAGLVPDGCDIIERPNYPFRYHLGDALEYLDKLITSGDIHRYALAHSSPPCQAQNPLTVGTNRSRGWGGEHEDLVPPTRELLLKAGIPYTIEQPNGRAKIRKDVSLCGVMFDLPVLRHRNFELGGWQTPKPKHVKHNGRVRGWRHGEYHDGPYVACYGEGGGKASIPEMQEAMGIDWTDVRKELTEAVPPAYGQWLGTRFLEWLREKE